MVSATLDMLENSNKQIDFLKNADSFRRRSRRRLPLTLRGRERGDFEQERLVRVVNDIEESFLEETSFGCGDPEREVKSVLAVKWTESGRISTGRAAEWLGISKPRFLREMGGYGRRRRSKDVILENRRPPVLRP